MNWKKLAALALAATMALSLSACTGKTGGAAGDSDWAYIEKKGSLKIGFTYFEPMNYLDNNGDFVGFETEFAKAVCEKLGLTDDFVEISWDAKVMELESKKIDCIWNGMTITPELSEALTISDPYIKNYQVVVIRTADVDKYKTTADLAAAKVEAEAGSAGEAAVQSEENLSKAAYTPVTKQTDALLELKSGRTDAAVMDFVLANALAGQGDYSDLMVLPDVQLSVEEYGVGLRKGSDVAAKVNEAMSALIEDGTLGALAEKYGLADLLLANQK